MRAGLTDRAVKVVMPGGTLEVVVDDDWQLEQIGFAQEIARRHALGRSAARALADSGRLQRRRLQRDVAEPSC